MSATTQVILSGNDAGWLTTVAKEIMDAGPRPASIDHLLRVVPRQFGTAINDAYVTANENGLGHDLQAGYRIWVTESVKALRKAKLIDGPDDDLKWIAAENGTWKVKLNRLITIYGKAERISGRDRHMLGDRSEKDGVLRTGLLLQGQSQPLTVHVRQGISGIIEKGENALEVHPLALAIPPMTAAEQEAIRADIQRHGVKVPVILFPDHDDLTARGRPKWKVLDGRHRVYFASETGQPVDVEVFKGTDDEARAHVASLNLYRRQLNTAQKAAAAVVLFGQQARDEAAEAEKATLKQNATAGTDLPQRTESQNGHGRWYERAAEMAGGKAAGITPAAVKHAAAIVEAPETLAKVMAGERGYVKIAAAERKAKEELGLAGATPVRMDPEDATIVRELRRAERALLNILEEEMHEPREPGRVAGQIAELKRLLPLVEDRARRLGLLA